MTFESYSGNLVEEILDTVDRVLLPYRECDGKTFHMGEFWDCPNKPVRTINGQDFCERCSLLQEDEVSR